MIEFESVGKTFRDGTAAVVDLTLTVPSDKITVIVGPSGCGKTTTLRMVNRMIEPTSGRILWDGSPLKSKRKTTLRRQMGYVIQNGGLFPHRTVLDNVGTVPGLLGWDKTKTRNRSVELLDAVGLDRKLVDRYPAQLSGGQQQRVGVARALAADPLVMLMDEPFSAVDPVVRSELHELFLGLQRELSKTIILITHDIDEAIKLGDQVAILRVGGRLAQVGTPQQLLDEPADAFVEGFVGRDRGFRALSFLPSSSLSLTRVRAVRDPASVTSHEPTLVVDGEAKPLGWADGRRPGQVYGLGSTFDPETDSLRAALDAALTSPAGVAVAVSHGRYAGVVRAEDILAQATESRVSIAAAASGGTASITSSDGSTSDDAGSRGGTAEDAGSEATGSRGGAHQLASSGTGSDVSGGAARGETRGDETAGDETVGDEAAGDETVGDEAAGDETVGDQTVGDRARSDSSATDVSRTDETSVSPRPEVARVAASGSAPAGADDADPRGARSETARSDQPRGAHALADLAPTADTQVGQPGQPERAAGSEVGQGDGRTGQSGTGAGFSQPEERESPPEHARGGSHAGSVSSEHQHAGVRERSFEGRASQEPGLTSDEFDGARTPWNPFKRPQ